MDVIKINEEGRYFYAIFDDLSEISVCKFFLKPPGASEVEFTPTTYTGTLDGEAIEAYRYKFLANDFTIDGEYSIEVYIERTDGYKGRREATKLNVFAYHSVWV